MLKLVAIAMYIKCVTSGLSTDTGRVDDHVLHVVHSPSTCESCQKRQGTLDMPTTKLFV
jgi:hypothetical protein